MSATTYKECSERMLTAISQVLTSDGNSDHLWWKRTSNADMLARLRIYMLDCGYPVDSIQHTDLLVT